MHRRQRNRDLILATVLIVLSLIVGAQLGLWLSRQWGPVRLSGAGAAELNAQAKDTVIILVAAAYAQDQDLAQAQARLELLDIPNVGQWVANLADRAIAEGWDEADIRALVALADDLGLRSALMAAYLPSPTPRPTNTPPPSPTSAPTATPTHTSIPPTETPLPPTDTPTPTGTAPPTLQPTDTPTNEPTPTLTPVPPTDTPRPRPTNTPASTAPPTQPPAPTWTWTARLIGPGEEGQQCDGGGNQMIRVTVLGPGGNPLPGVAVYEYYSGQYRISGHKADDPYWGPGDAEFSSLLGGRLCIASGEGGTCVSDFTRELPCHEPPPVEDLWAAGYCECWEPGITLEQCRANLESGYWLKIGNYYWRVEFKRSR